MTKKAKAVKTPRDLSDCDEWVAEYGRLQRHLARIETEMNETLARAKTEAEAESEPLQQQLEATYAGIRAWCDAHRDELTAGGESKTYRFGNGNVSWRAAPRKVSISKKTKIGTIVDWLREAPAKFQKFVRPKFELNKEAMLADPELAAEVPGVSIKSAGEAFEVTPFEARLEKAA